VGAFHVVGKDLQLRFGIDRCRRRQQDRLIGLLGIRLLSVLVDKDLSVKDAKRMVAED